MSSIVSILLLTSTLSAQTHCKDGKCFIDLKKLSPSKSVESKVHAFKTLKKPLSYDIETILLDPFQYIMSEAEKEFFNPSEPTLYNDKNTIVLAHSKYIMTEEEKERYYEEERLKVLQLEKEEVIEPIILVEEKIIEKSILPNSDFFCEMPKKAKYHPESNSYECV